jgi:hypothetical protein
MTDVTVETPPKRTMTEELKAKMRAGRERAAAERRAKMIARNRPPVQESKMAEQPKAEVVSRETISHSSNGKPFWLGGTHDECPVDCTPQLCVITHEAHCGHPRKGGIQSAHRNNPEVVGRFNEFRKHLAHGDVDKRHDK